MMKLIAIWILSFSFAQAYTLNNNFGASFKNKKVKVYIDSTTACPGVTKDDLQNMINPAVDRFWNTAPTSSLRLSAGGFSTETPNINHGVLCSPTDDTCINNAGGSVIPPVKDIIIACNDEAQNFIGGNVLAVTVPNSFSGKKIAGSVILINTAGGFSALSYKDKLGVLAHEIGHAIGLGHSEDSASLMFFRTINQRDRLGQDDIDGVTYLYPMIIDGFGVLGGCGTISQGNNPPKDPPFWQMGITLGLLILLFEILKLLTRSKARTTA